MDDSIGTRNHLRTAVVQTRPILFDNIDCQIPVSRRRRRSDPTHHNDFPFASLTCDTGYYFLTFNLSLALPLPGSNENPRSTSVSSSLSTEFAPVNPIPTSPPANPSLPYSRRNTGNTFFSVLLLGFSTGMNNTSHLIVANQTPPPSRSSHLCVNGKRKCEHPSKKSSVDPSIFTG